MNVWKSIRQNHIWDLSARHIVCGTIATASVTAHHRTPYTAVGNGRHIYIIGIPDCQQLQQLVVFCSVKLLQAVKQAAGDYRRILQTPAEHLLYITFIHSFWFYGFWLFWYFLHYFSIYLLHFHVTPAVLHAWVLLWSSEWSASSQDIVPTSK